MTKFINKIFLAILLLISSITYSQTVLLNQNPTNAFVGPAANCANSTPGDPTSNTFPFSVNTDCYQSVDVSITLIPENPNNAALIPGFEAGDSVEITLTDDNGSTTSTIAGASFNGNTPQIFTAIHLNPGATLDISVL